MKIVVNREKLLEAFKKILPITNVNGATPSLPILGNVKLETENDNVVITGTNLDSHVMVTVPCTVETKGATTLPIKRLNNLIKEMVRGDVTIDSSDNDVSIIKCGSSKFKVNGLPVADFPANSMKLSDEVPSVTITQKSFKDIMRHASYAVSSDTARMVLTGVLLEFDDMTLNVVSTDGRRLAFDRMDVGATLGTKTFDPKVQVLLPALINEEVNKLLTEEGDVKIKFNKDCISFELGDVYLVSKLLCQTYPNYKQVIPHSQTYSVKVNREEYLAVLKRVSTMSEKNNGNVSVCFTSGKITVSCTANNIGYAEDSMAVDYIGPETKISLNPEYLIETLTALESETLQFSFEDCNSPCVIRGDSSAFSLIMPLRVN